MLRYIPRKEYSEERIKQETYFVGSLDAFYPTIYALSQFTIEELWKMEVISDVQSQFYMGHHSTEHNGKQLLDYVFLEKKLL